MFHCFEIFGCAWNYTVPSALLLLCQEKVHTHWQQNYLFWMSYYKWKLATIYEWAGQFMNWYNPLSERYQTKKNSFSLRVRVCIYITCLCGGSWEGGIISLHKYHLLLVNSVAGWPGNSFESIKKFRNQQS